MNAVVLVAFAVGVVAGGMVTAWVVLILALANQQPRPAKPPAAPAEQQHGRLQP